MSKLFWIFVALLAAQWSFIGQPDETLEPINEANAHRIEQVQMLGLGGIYDLIWSPSGAELAVLGPNGVRIYDALDWTVSPIHLGDSLYYTWTGSFDPTGQLLATTDREGWRLWDVTSNRLLRRVQQTRQFGISTLTFSPEGNLLVSTGTNGASAIIQLWDPTNGRELAYLEVENAYQSIQSVSFNNDGSELLVVSGTGEVYIYNLAELLTQNSSTAHIAELEGIEGISQAEYDDAGELYILRLLRLPDDQRQYVLQTADDEVTSVMTIPDGGHQIQPVDFDPNVGILVTSNTLGDIEVYSTETGEAVHVFTGSSRVTNISIDPTGRQLVVYVNGYLLTSYDLTTMTEQVISDQYIQFGYAVKFHPNSTWLAFGTEILEGQIQLWDTVSGTIIERIPGHPNGGWTPTVAFQPDGDRIASGSGTGCCPRVWDLRTGEMLQSFVGHGVDFRTRGINRVFFIQEGNVLVSAGDDSAIRFWNVQTGETINIFEHDNQEVSSAVVGGNDQYLFSVTSPRSQLWIWNIASGQQLETVSQTHTADHLLMTHDQSLIATMIRGVFTFWDAYTAEVIGQIDVSQTVTSTADAVFSPDGTMIATVSSGGRLHLISVETGSILAEIQTIDNWLTTSIDWSSDGRRIAITGREGSVHIYGVLVSEEY